METRLFNKVDELLGRKFSRKDVKSIISTMGLDGAHLVEHIDDSLDEEDGRKAITAADIAIILRGIGYEVAMPGMAQSAAAPPPQRQFQNRQNMQSAPQNSPVTPPPPFSPDVTPREPEDEFSMKSIYQTRFNDKTSAQKAVLKGVIGDNYAEILYNQKVAFTKAMRYGQSELSLSEVRSLKAQIFPLDRIHNAVVEEGMTVANMKAVQIEAAGKLGGFAVPPQYQGDISKRLPGLTAVRGGGARVVTLLNTNSVEIPQWKGTSDRYIGELRGTWGSETKNPDEDNFELEMVQVPAHIYTYKIPMSLSLVEDASNLVSMLMEDIVSTLAMDEDEAFLIGTGVGRPSGILPGGDNAYGIKEVNSGDAANLTVAGIKKLKRGIASQYRKGGKWVANSDSYAIMEAFTAGAGTTNWAFPDLSDEEMLLKRQALESEAMADVAANAYPLLFGDFSGYTIVERLGMSIERFHDSNTGINKVEYHVRKRTGGAVEKPWMFAVQKVSA